MGKLSLSEAEKLRNEGIISEERYQEMLNSGMISKRKRNPRKYMKTQQGNLTCPQFYFQGIGKDDLTNEMNELRTKVDQLITEYAKE